jgi:cytoskeletal protein CcmA (bactofilin family)
MPSGRYNDFSVNTIIGPGPSLKGDMDIAGFTRIDGSIIGNVNATGKMVIGERARMKSNVSGTAITIGGVVYGNVIAGESLSILSTALVLGDVITRRIKADEGCLIHGRVLVRPDEESWNRAVSEYRDAQGIKSALPVFTREPVKKDGAKGAAAESVSVADTSIADAPLADTLPEGRKPNNG